MENKGKIKVLQINASSKNFGGVSAMIFQIYKYIDKDKFQFDFLSPQITTYEIKRDEIEANGGKIIELKVNGNKIKQRIQLYKRLKKVLKQNNYNIVHINSGRFFFNLQVAFICKLCYVNKTIVHSHNTLNPKKKLRKVLIKTLKPILNLFVTDYLTCSKEAAEAMFTKGIIKKNKVEFIPNGIETKKFKFDQEVRKKYREDLNIENKFVIGHVGRFVEEKNHKFLVDVFNKYYQKHKDSVLFLVGEGELENQVKDYVKSLNLENCVKFLGLRTDIANLMMAFDIFVLPSMHEGLPVVGVEAQASGLPIVFSNNVTKQVQILSTTKYLSLSDEIGSWVDTIEKTQNLQEYIRVQNRLNAYKEVIQKGFDIEQTVKKIEKIYLKDTVK